MIDWGYQFYAWFLRLLLASLRGASSQHIDKTAVEIVLPSSVQVAGEHGRHVLPTRSDKKWQRGEVAFVLHRGNERWLLGDKPVYKEPPPETKRGGGVAVLPMPHQPVTHEGILTFAPLEIGPELQPVISWVTLESSGDGGIIVG